MLRFWDRNPPPRVQNNQFVNDLVDVFGRVRWVDVVATADLGKRQVNKGRPFLGNVGPAQAIVFVGHTPSWNPKCGPGGEGFKCPSHPGPKPGSESGVALEPSRARAGLGPGVAWALEALAHHPPGPHSGLQLGIRRPSPLRNTVTSRTRTRRNSYPLPLGSLTT